MTQPPPPEQTAASRGPPRLSAAVKVLEASLPAETIAPSRLFAAATLSNSFDTDRWGQLSFGSCLLPTFHLAKHLVRCRIRATRSSDSAGVSQSCESPPSRVSVMPWVLKGGTQTWGLLSSVEVVHDGTNVTGETVLQRKQLLGRCPEVNHRALMGSLDFRTDRCRLSGDLD